MTRDQYEQLPPKEKEHFAKCQECGEMFDRRSLDEVLFDTDHIPQFGLVAEDVEKVNPALVARDANGEVYTVRYEAVNAMLLNEFLKEHRKVEQLEKQIEALTAGLQKVSAEIELSKPARIIAEAVNDRSSRYRNEPSRFYPHGGSLLRTRNDHGSWKSPLCSCVLMTLPASS
jgi:hypothetical protein